MSKRLAALRYMRFAALPVLFVTSTFVAGCSGASSAPAGAAAPPPAITQADVPLIPRRLLFGNPERAGASLSDDGTQLAFRAAVDGVMNVWVAPFDSPEAARPVTKDTSRGVRQYFWAYDNAHIIYLQDKGGDENWRVYSVDVTSGATRDLTPFDKVAAQIQGVSDRFPDEILIALNDRNPELHDLYRINVVTGKRALVQRNDKYAGFVTDDDFTVRFAQIYRPDGGLDLLRRTAAGTFEPFESIGSDDALTTQPIGFDKGGQHLYLIDSRGRDTAALFSQDVNTGMKTLLAEDARADAEGVLTHPQEKTIQAVAFNYDRVRWQVIDKQTGDDLKYLQGVTDGEISVLSRSMKDARWIVAYVKDHGPVRYYVYDRPSRTAKFLFTNRPSLESARLARMHPQEIKARDELTLVSYLSLPVWTDADGNGRPASPLPTVLFVHGGPWGRDVWGFDTIHQLLANRGYAVLSVNFRASTGFGKKFLNAGNREWGAKMHDDLLDAVKWAVDQHIADPQKTAIMGGSYGGYATLAGLTFTPDVFAAGVDIVGPSNLVTLLSTIPAYWKPQVELFATRVGDNRTDEGRKFLESRSPLTRVDKISKPLLIGQGANDPRVKQAESDQIVKAMQAKNIPVTYTLFPDEGHGFARPENNIAFMAIAEAFLAKHLGGRAEPIGDAFKGSSVKVPQGPDLVPGVKDALQPAAVTSSHE
ncbi:MAG TPA: S9 family peptidase [Vicinamibacterales bacterium]|nr:S9 family peptidase [Vicinamibacterales bacterium]